MRADRFVGLFLLALALWYGLEALGLEAGYLADPLGPRAFPLLLSAVLLGLSLFMVFRPAAGVGVGFPAWKGQLAVIASFVVYSELLLPLGFVLATTLEVAFVARWLGASWGKGAAAGFGFSLALYLIFVFGLGIPLPLGQWWPA